MSTSVEGLDTYEDKVYFDQCGWVGYEYGSATRLHFRFSDSHLTGEYKHSGKPDSYRPDVDSLPLTGSLMTSQFAGIVCIAGDDASCTTRDCRKLGTGDELWRTDGTVEGTSRMDDIWPGSQGSYPSDLVSFGTHLYFAASTNDDGRELWKTTGTEFGTAELVSVWGSNQGINPSGANADPKYMTVAADIASGISHLFFAATDSIRGRELWMETYTTATQASRLSFVDVVTGIESSDPRYLCSSGGSVPLYFSAYDSTNGRELWKTDGTAAGTVIVKDINTGSSSSNPSYMIWYNNMLYFQAEDGVDGRELWKSDGTSVGTVLVKDIRIGDGSSNPSFFSIFTSPLDNAQYLMFTATDGYMMKGNTMHEGIGGSQFWRSDGTASGTYRSFPRSFNDLYIDRDSLDIQHPSKLPIFQQGVYVPAAFKSTGHADPAGGSIVANDDQTFGVDQALVVTDIDTAPDGNVTMVLSVDKGILAMKAATNIGASSNAALRFIVAEASTTDRTYLSNALIAAGHFVNSFTTGEAAMAAMKAKYEDWKLYPGTERGWTYDCMMLSLEFDNTNIMDGIQITREIRTWEQRLPLALNGYDFNPIKMIGMSKLRKFIGRPDQSDVFTAGMNKFMYQPDTDYIPSAQLNNVLSLPNGTSTTYGEYASEKQRLRFQDMASVAIGFLTEIKRDVNITTELSPDRTPSASILATLPAQTIGEKITIEGTLAQVNAAMRGVFFYAPSGINGDITITATVTDHPAVCLGYDGLLPSNPQNFVQRPALAILPASDTYGSFGNVSNVHNQFCDKNQSRSTTRTIPIYATALNQPPGILLSNPSLVSQVNLDTPVPGFTIIDIDHLQGMTILNSVGVERQPPVTVTMATLSGTITLLYRDNIVFLTGQGSMDKNIVLRGPLDEVNKAMQQITYKCETNDGCMGGYVDMIHITVDDEGFQGKGGPMTFSTMITASITQ